MLNLKRVNYEVTFADFFRSANWWGSGIFLLFLCWLQVRCLSNYIESIFFNSLGNNFRDNLVLSKKGKREKMKINKSTTIEELVTIAPESVSHLMDRGIRPLICGEPIWGTIEEVVISKGYSREELDRMLQELNRMVERR